MPKTDQIHFELETERPGRIAQDENILLKESQVLPIYEVIMKEQQTKIIDKFKLHLKSKMLKQEEAPKLILGNSDTTYKVDEPEEIDISAGQNDYVE